MRFAENTSVPVERSKTELERTLTRYRAEKFAYFTDATTAAIAFAMRGRSIRIRLPLPREENFARTPAGKPRMLAARRNECDKATRQAWRALLLVVRAKLEAVESGIATFEDEFLAYTMLPNGKTVGEQLGPSLELAHANGEMPRLALGFSGDAP